MTDEQEVSCEDTTRTLKGESKGEANPTNCDVASGGEECAEGLERDGGAVEVVKGVETHCRYDGGHAWHGDCRG